MKTRADRGDERDLHGEGRRLSTVASQSYSVSRTTFACSRTRDGYVERESSRQAAQGEEELAIPVASHSELPIKCSVAVTVSGNKR